MNDETTRLEKDSLGTVEVPGDARYGAQTQRAINNFHFSTHRMPAGFIQALAHIKWACAAANSELGILDEVLAPAIQSAADRLCRGEYADQFPIDVFQTGSGTSTNMNMNEVIANLASEHSGSDVHPNDHVNMSQSSNDVIPTAIHVSASIAVQSDLLPALLELAQAVDEFGVQHRDVVKTGRTHLMDAMPITVEQECSAWAAQLQQSRERLQDVLPRLQSLALGGTAVGTGINAPQGFAAKAIGALSSRTGLAFTEMDNRFAGISSQDTAVELSGHLNTLAVALTKIANDLRWMNSGPITGLQEIQLPALQPGSSIMPGKVNPVIPEAVLMASAQVIGNHATVTTAGMSGNFQLNVMLPIIAHNLLESVQLLSASCHSLAEKVFTGMTVNAEHLAGLISKNPILITALNRKIGYEKGALIAKRAYQEKRPLIDIALEEIALEDSGLDEASLRAMLNPADMT